MRLFEQLEHGKMKTFVHKGRRTRNYRKYLKLSTHRAWRRYKGLDKPMYNRYKGWEL